MLIVPVVARLLRSVFAHPNRVVMTPARNEELLIGMVVVSAPRHEWEYLTVRPTIPEVTLHNIVPDSAAALTEENEEQRRFRVQAPIHSDIEGTAVHVWRAGQELPVLSIPLVVAKREGVFAP